MDLGIEKIKDYFKAYNQQVKQVPGISGFYEIDISGDLESIATSIKNPIRSRDACSIPNNYTCRYRNRFCIEILGYFLKTGNVPEYNVKDIIASAKEKLAFPIGKSFKKFSAKTRLLRIKSKKPSKINKANL